MMGEQFGGEWHYQASPSGKPATTTFAFPDLIKALPWIIFMGIFAVILSMALVIAISKYPKVIIYSLMGFTFLLIAGGIIAGIAMGLM